MSIVLPEKMNKGLKMLALSGAPERRCGQLARIERFQTQHKPENGGVEHDRVGLTLWDHVSDTSELIGGLK